MGLQSALTTALTGLNAAEATIDVVGNNLANSGTVGFKASEAVFATQFLQTRSLGSAPTENSGGTNPRQIGLGVQVAEITPDFTQGTIEISSNPSDLAIQGDGFFIVQSSTGENLYTRNGIFKTNSQNELVTITGNRLLGFGVDEDFNINSTTLEPITIPLGASAVAQATENVYFEGTLTPTGDLADTAEIIDSAVLADNSYDMPVVTGPPPTSLAVAPEFAGAFSAAVAASPGPIPAGTYHYRIALVDAFGQESDSLSATVTVPAGGGDVQLNIPAGNAPYTSVNIYRTAGGAPVTGPFYLLDNQPGFAGGPQPDINPTDPPSAMQMNTASLTGQYTYYISYVRPGLQESRPVQVGTNISVTNDRIMLDDLPTPPAGSDYDNVATTIRIYRNLANSPNTFYRVGEVPPSQGYFIDGMSDTNAQTQAAIDFNGPKINTNTLLTDIIRYDGRNYISPFTTGTLAFSPKKGGRDLEPAKELTITATTTVQDLMDFMVDAFGIQSTIDDPANPIPPDISGQAPGAYIVSSGADAGKIRIIGNNGVDNAVDIGLSDFELTPTVGVATRPDLQFNSVQAAVGQSAVSDFIVYDSLGIPLPVRVTVVMETRDNTSTTYRWFADSTENAPLSGVEINVGTGLIQFDGEGNVTNVTNTTVSIDRETVSSVSPLEFELDFSRLSGLAAERSTLSASRQDGSPAGTLSSFIVGEDGLIRGVFTNGITRDLGQIRLARFANPSGLEQRGENMFAAGINSGLPIEGNPNEQGIGGLVAGAQELSNTDIGKNLIDLILASTQYRGNTRVITTSQQLFDELLNLRR